MCPAPYYFFIKLLALMLMSKCIQKYKLDCRKSSMAFSIRLGQVVDQTPNFKIEQKKIKVSFSSQASLQKFCVCEQMAGKNMPAMETLSAQ